TPTLRTQDQAPVVDAGGGGSDMLSAAGAEPPVLHAPLVVAPLPMLPAPVVPTGASAGAPGPRPGGAEAGGARGPHVPEPGPPTTHSANSNLRLTPLSGQATRVGYPRDFRTPTVGDIAALAMPGVAGLMFMTFGGSMLGYRQANSVGFIRTQAAER